MWHPTPGAREQRPSFSPAWFAGIDLRLLAKTPSERTFYDVLGLTVLMLACASGFALTVAAGYAFQTPSSRLWWIGLAWAAIVACGIERLILQLPTTRKELLPVVLIPRILLSLLLAVQIGEPLMLRINQSELNDTLSAQRAAEIHQATTTAADAYASKIATRTKAIASIRTQENALRAKAEHYTFLSACESNTPSCSYTGRPGCGTYCLHYRRLAEAARFELAGRLPADSANVSRLRAEIATLRAAQAQEVSGRTRAIDGRNGLVARIEALHALERAHPEVATEVWFLRLFFICLDLLPLTAKVLRMLSFESPYESAAASSRASDLLQAKREAEAARVEHERIAEQGRADVEFNRARIQIELDARVAAAETAAHRGGTRRPTRTATVAAPSLGTFVQEIEMHESRPVPMPWALRRAGLVGAAMIAACGVIWLAIVHAGSLALLLVIAALASATAIGFYTGGFRRAPRWALYATFAVFAAGLALPVALAVVTLT